VISFDEEPIVAYFNNPDCNNSVETDGEWILNENINFCNAPIPRIRGRHCDVYT